MRHACCALRGLSGRRHVALHRQLGQKRLHLGFAHLPGVALAVEKDVSFYPVDVRSLGPLGVPSRRTRPRTWSSTLGGEAEVGNGG